MTDNWCEIVGILQSAKENHSITEQGYQDKIERCLTILGWRQYNNDTMRSQNVINIGSNKSLRPDIVLYKDGQEVLPIEIKRPTNLCNQRQAEQLTSYMRQLKLNVGLFIGENIQLYYDKTQDKKATSVFCAEISKNDSNGDRICDLLCYDSFTIQDLEKFCLEQYQCALEHKKLQRRFRDFLNENAVKDVIKERFLQEGFDEKAVDAELSKISVDIRWNKVEPFRLKEMGNPIKRVVVRNEEPGYSKPKGKSMGRTVLDIIKEYVATHAGISFAELQRQFPDYLIGSHKSLGVVRTLASIDEKVQEGYLDLRNRKRYFFKPDDIIVLKDGTEVVVCTQWERPIFEDFRKHVEKLS